MEYIRKELKKGIDLHGIFTDKFKTNLITVYLTVPLNEKTVTKNALIPAVLRRGTMDLPSMRELGIYLEDMYGSSFDCTVEKRGDNQVLKFCIEALSDRYIKESSHNLENAIKLILDIITNPVLENGIFKENHLEEEKETIRQIILSKSDDKAMYAVERCIENMFKGTPYGIYKYGDVKDLETITSSSLYEEYIQVLNTCKIDIFVVGHSNIEEIEGTLNRYLNIEQRQAAFCNVEDRSNQEEKEIIEKMDISQGKLVMGFRTGILTEEKRKAANVYNTILGGSSNSKLFQIVREKHHLAYTAGSNYLINKDSFLARCGIEIKNYEKTVKLVKEQIEDIANGKFNEEDLINAKTYIKNGIKATNDKLYTIADFFFTNIILSKNGHSESIEEYIENIEKVTLRDVTDLAKEVKLDTVYFLRN